MTRSRKKRGQDGRVKSVVSDVVPSELLDVSGAAKWLGVSRSTFFTLMREENIPVIRLTERIVRFDPNSLYVWVLAHQDRIV